jgi:CRP-like cAMP-binding protein
MLDGMSMTLKEQQSFLAGVDIFAKCKGRNIRALAKSCEERTFPTGAALCRQGQRGVAMYVITRGQVRVEEELSDGRAVQVATLGPGATVGEMAIIDGAERTASVIAETDVDVLVLTSWDFKAMLRSRPEVALDILPVIVGRLRKTVAELRRRSGEHIKIR